MVSTVKEYRKALANVHCASEDRFPLVPWTRSEWSLAISRSMTRTSSSWNLVISCAASRVQLSLYRIFKLTVMSQIVSTVRARASSVRNRDSTPLVLFRRWPAVDARICCCRPLPPSMVRNSTEPISVYL